MQGSLISEGSCFRYLYSNYLTGTIPPSIGNLTQLHSDLCVEFESKITTLSFIEYYVRDLSSNALSGPIPSSIGNCEQLLVL